MLVQCEYTIQSIHRIITQRFVDLNVLSIKCLRMLCQDLKELIESLLLMLKSNMQIHYDGLAEVK